MPKIKEVPSKEVHWQIPALNVRDAANARVKSLLGGDAKYLAPVYVTHNSYYWSDADTTGWSPLSIAPEAEQLEARQMIADIYQRALRNNPAQKEFLSLLFSFPNDDYVFVRRGGDAHIELRITGWGFRNYNRVSAGPIREEINEDKLNDIRLTFSVDGSPVPGREFTYAQGKGFQWAAAKTDDEGYYNFGRQMPGTEVSVRDTATGREHTEVVTSTTGLINVDVTEFLTIRVIANSDGEGLNESAEVVYGSRSVELTLSDGVAVCTLPWFENKECAVTCHGETQRRELRKDIVNEFNFDFKTPKTPHTHIEVRLTDNGQPIVGERVMLMTPVGPLTLVTSPNGVASYDFDLPQEGGNITATVRDRSETKQAIDGNVIFEMAFDSIPPTEFDAFLKVINLEDEPVAFYPVKINIGDGTPTVDCLTNEKGMVGPIRVLSSNTMTVYDGNDPDVNEEFELDVHQQEYIFQLPYSNVSNLGDMSLRVVQRNGAPAAGATIILAQNDIRLTAQLDNNGAMTFGHDDFDYATPITVNVYSQYRSFPTIPLQLEKDEYEYELVEVDGPQPWWKIAGEIALAGGAVLLLAGAYFAMDAFYYSFNNSF